MRHLEQTRSAVSWPPTAPTPGITVYGCDPDEAVLFREAAARLGATPTIIAAPVSAANAGLASGSRCVSVGHKAQIPNPALLALSRAGVAYISTRSVGFNHLDVAYAASLGVRVENVAYSPDSVADYTLMLMLMAVRHAKAVVRGAEVHDYRLPEVRGRELRDLTVGVVGTGRIGAAVVQRLRGFGCGVLVCDSSPKVVAEHVSVDELVRRSDIVTLHVPLDAGTRHLLGAQRIGAMRRGAFVVNTGRGGLVDTAALVAALESGHLGGAALDVVEGEEGVFYADRRNTPVESGLLLRLQALPNAIVSPHTAYYTDHALRDMVENSIVNCLAFENGGPLHG